MNARLFKVVLSYLLERNLPVLDYNTIRLSPSSYFLHGTMTYIAPFLYNIQKRNTIVYITYN